MAHIRRAGRVREVGDSGRDPAAGQAVMNDPVSWSEFLRAVELSRAFKIAAIYGYIARVDPGEGVEPLPGEWDLDIQQGHRADGHELMVRVIANASGPGGRLTVDGMGTFESTLPPRHRTD